LYSVKVEDPLWHRLYQPIVRAAEVVARMVGQIQQGRISVYLTYSFFTLLALLFFVR
jgi:hydrogenase-4 component B